VRPARELISIQLELEGCVPLASELQSSGGSTTPSFVCPRWTTIRSSLPSSSSSL
jgi:hypothetical protein